MACVLTIGNFDGVHLGHQQILALGRKLADEAGVPLVAKTFDRHPAQLLKPEEAPPVLLTVDQRVRWLKHFGADRVDVMPMTTDALGEPAEAFVERMVRESRPIAFAEGPDFRFGHQRGGDNDLLKTMGERLSFATHVIEPVAVDLSEEKPVRVSSSLLRRLLEQGRVEDAERCLGRPFALTAEVVQGEQRGRTIGVPTANLDPVALAGILVPAHGVYAGRAQVQIDGAATEFDAAISVGVKPTFGHQQMTVEAHLFDLPVGTDLYGQPITLLFERWIRPQMAFADAAELIAQIEQDLQACRR